MTKQYWEEQYKDKGRITLNVHPAIDRFTKYFKQAGLKKALDLGCGSGRHLVKLAENGFAVTGIDHSPSAASLAEKWLHSKKLPGKVYVADIGEKLSFFEDGSFDIVVCINSLEYNSKDKFQKLLKEINRILKTGGSMALVVPSDSAKDGEIETLKFTKDELKEIIESHFRIIEFSLDDDAHHVILAQEK